MQQTTHIQDMLLLFHSAPALIYIFRYTSKTRVEQEQYKNRITYKPKLRLTLAQNFRKWCWMLWFHDFPVLDFNRARQLNCLTESIHWRNKKPGICRFWRISTQLALSDAFVVSSIYRAIISIPEIIIEQRQSVNNNTLSLKLIRKFILINKLQLYNLNVT